MKQVSVKEMRNRLTALLDEVAAGEEFTLTRQGKPIARLVPMPPAKQLPSLKAFRDTIHLKGEPMSETVIRLRREARY